MKKDWHSMVSQLQARLDDPYPLQYILEEALFCGEWFWVTPKVLIPRIETEVLVEYIISVVDQKSKTQVKILDLGTGCGNIAVILAKRLNCVVYAVDVSDDALCVAKKNAIMHGVLDRIKFYKSDWYAPLETKNDFVKQNSKNKHNNNLKSKKNGQSLTGYDGLETGSADIIVSNPPYIAESEWDSLPVEVKNYEPKISLWGGRQGLDSHKKIILGSKNILKQGGMIALEIGYNQADAVKNLMDGFKNIEVVKDQFGKDRVITGLWIN